MDEVNHNRMKVVYAIPSPARRDHKGWILTPEPLWPAREQFAAETSSSQG